MAIHGGFYANSANCHENTTMIMINYRLILNLSNRDKAWLTHLSLSNQQMRALQMAINWLTSNMDTTTTTHDCNQPKLFIPINSKMTNTQHNRTANERYVLNKIYCKIIVITDGGPKKSLREWQAQPSAVDWGFHNYFPLALPATYRSASQDYFHRSDSQTPWCRDPSMTLGCRTHRIWNSVVSLSLLYAKAPLRLTSVREAPRAAHKRPSRIWTDKDDVPNFSHESIKPITKKNLGHATGTKKCPQMAT